MCTETNSSPSRPQAVALVSTLQFIKIIAISFHKFYQASLQARFFVKAHSLCWLMWGFPPPQVVFFQWVVGWPFATRNEVSRLKFVQGTVLLHSTNHPDFHPPHWKCLGTDTVPLVRGVAVCCGVANVTLVVGWLMLSCYPTRLSSKTWRKKWTGRTLSLANKETGTHQKKRSCS